MKIQMLAILLLLSPMACSDDSGTGPNPDASTPVPDTRAMDSSGGDDSSASDMPASDTARNDGATPGDDMNTDSGAGDTGNPGDGGTDAGAADSSTDSTVDADTVTGTPCTADGECGTEHWCRDKETGGKECVPYALEGDHCGGFTLPSYVSRCHPDFICSDYPDYIADAPGKCRRPCANTPCPSGQYCSASNTVCRDMGACLDHLDCDASANNNYTHDACGGYGICNAGSCSWVCGDPACRDLEGLYFGFCNTSLGWAIVDSSCQEIFGCDAGGYTMHASLAACTAACI